MSAQLWNRLLYLAEATKPGMRTVDRFRRQCGLHEDDPELLEVLNGLIQPQVGLYLTQTCEAAANNKKLPYFWRALAAYQRGRLTNPALPYPDNPDGWCVRANSLASWIWEDPEDKTQVNPDALYFYYLRIFDHLARVVDGKTLPQEPQLNPDMAILGAEHFIQMGWFDAPKCVVLVVDAKASGLIECPIEHLEIQLDERRAKPRCYFSREQSLHLPPTVRSSKLVAK